jgi:hypothetical protein
MATVLTAPTPDASPFATSPLHSYPDLTSLETTLQYEQTTSQSSLYTRHGYEGAIADSIPSTAPSSPQLTYSSRRDSYASTPASSVSLDHGDESEEGDYDMAFPSYGSNVAVWSKSSETTPTSSVSSGTPTQTPLLLADDASVSTASIHDDSIIEVEPSRHVDYLSHEWKEEDLWKSWSYVSHRRGSIANSTRLENASWRSWTKAKNHLRTVSPETLNWLKDCDVTWLYGPLQVPVSAPLSRNTSPPPSRISHSSSFISKKPILKKKSYSAAILERSRSTHSLLQRASDIIRVQQSNHQNGRPLLRRGNSEFTLPSYDSCSVANSPVNEESEPSMTTVTRTSLVFDAPTPLEIKHVLFNEEVRQVQAIDSEDDEKPEEPDVIYETDEDDDGGLMMAPQRLDRSSNRTTPRGSFSNESKTIVPLPSTTLKYRNDTPEPPEVESQQGLWSTRRKLASSTSQETLRPSNPSHNFLIDDDPEVGDDGWSSQSTLSGERVSYDEERDNTDQHPTMRRTDSGMFMPYEDEDEAAMNNTLFGQAMYAVNTFRDIAHVVWNVGWNRR